MPKGTSGDDWQEFLGQRYYRSAGNRYYWRKRPRSEGRKSVSLHVAVWEHHKGPVPKGFHVHHRDEDPANCALDNLELIEPAAHGRLHMAKRSLPPPREKAHAGAAAWHRSSEGREWHRQHGRATWENAEPETFECVRCGKPYECVRRARKRGFCSLYCQSRARIESGVDNEVRVCQGCGEQFSINRYSRTRHCSHACVKHPRRPRLQSREQAEPALQ